jgi:hypothetical protein
MHAIGDEIPSPHLFVLDLACSAALALGLVSFCTRHEHELANQHISVGAHVVISAIRVAGKTPPIYEEVCNCITVAANRDRHYSCSSHEPHRLYMVARTKIFISRIVVPYVS